jgi:hypothetical protein
MTVAYYAVNIQGLTWVKPIHDLTGGALCTDREVTCQQAQAEFNGADVRCLTPGKRLSVRGGLRQSYVSLARIARELRPDVVVTTANFPHYIRRDWWGALWQGGAFPNVKQAQVFHGISSKHNKFQAFMAHYDLLLLVGERDKQRFENIGVLQKTRWRLIGLPRSDRIARGELNRDATLRELGLNVARPTVLYAPTHGSLSSFFRWGLSVCQAVSADCNLMVKPHPIIAQAVAASDVDGATWTAVQNYVAERGNAVFLPSHSDIQELMVAADALVTDFSSAAEEFLIFNRPLVFANHLAEGGYHLKRGEWDEIQSCGEVVNEERNLPAAIARALEHPEQFEPQRTRMRDDVFYRVDGQAAARAAAALRELSEENGLT